MTDDGAAELARLARDLRRAGTQIGPTVQAVVSKGALNIKRQMVAEMSASQHFRGAARGISYDLKTSGRAVEALIGPRSGRGQPGALANIAYFGTSRGGGTVPDPRGAMNAEEPRLMDALTNALRDLL